MAFCAIAAGLYDSRALSQLKSLPDNKRQMLGGYKIQRNKIPSLFTSKFIKAMEIYGFVKTWGMPYGPAWAENPAHITKLVQIFDNAATIAEKERPKTDGIRRAKTSR